MGDLGAGAGAAAAGAHGLGFGALAARLGLALASPELAGYGAYGLSAAGRHQPMQSICSGRPAACHTATSQALTSLLGVPSSSSHENSKHRIGVLPSRRVA